MHFNLSNPGTAPTARESTLRTYRYFCPYQIPDTYQIVETCEVRCSCV